MATYDAVVVGAGPGGSAAAYFLAASGAKVLVLERKPFPRAKTCGDGLTPRAIRVLSDMGLAPELSTFKQVSGLRVRGMRRTLHIDFPKVTGLAQYGLVRPRKDLDATIAARARAAGAEFRMQTEALSPIVEDGVVRGVRWATKEQLPGGGVVKTEEGDARAPFVVVADGAASSFGRAMGIEREGSFPVGLAIRTYYRSDRDRDDYFESWLELRKGDDLLPGYGWIFPVGDGTVNIGVGLLTTFGNWRSVNLSRLQRAYIDLLPPSYGITHEDQTEPFKSGRLPMAGSLLKPYGPGYVVIGDAAGFVNPFNGEGIAYALETGQLAAGAISTALSEGRSTNLRGYHEALHDTYAAYFRIGRKFTKVIGRPEIFNALCAVGLRFQPVMEFVFQVCSNLGEPRGGGMADRVLRGMVKLASYDLPADPVIPLPKGYREPKQEAGAA